MSWHVNGGHPPSKTPVDVLPWTAGVEGNDRADRQLAGKATITSGLRLGRSKVLRSLCHYLRAQSQGHHRSVAWRREAWKEKALDDLPWKDERGPSSIRRTLEPFQRQRRKTSERQGGAHMGFSESTDTINGTEQLSFEYLLNVRARNPRYEFKSSVRYSTTIPPGQPPCSQTGTACWMFDDG